MRNQFKSLSDKIKDSAFVIPLQIWLLILIIAALIINVRDWWTSYQGVALMQVYNPTLDPTVATSEFDIWLYFFARVAISLLPQAVTVVGSYTVLAMNPESGQESALRWTAIAITLVAISADVYTGYMYYMQQGGGFAPVPLDALFNSLFIDTVMSEVLLSFSLGLALELIEPFEKQLVRMRKDRGRRQGGGGGSSRGGRSSGGSSERSQPPAQNFSLPAMPTPAPTERGRGDRR